MFILMYLELKYIYPLKEHFLSTCARAVSYPAKISICVCVCVLETVRPYEKASFLVQLST